jgi:tellurite resistance-related uncharacterized protein
MDWPSTLVPDHRTKEFTQDTIPEGLLKDHTTKDGVWAMIRVLEGELIYKVGDDEQSITPKAPGFIEPQVLHSVEATESVRFYIEFYRDASA